MHKKIVLGGGDAFISDSYIKSKVIDWLYSKLDLSKHRYIILNTTQKLEFLQKNIHLISPNFKGYNYLIIMLTIDMKKYCVAIDRKKLSYHKEQLDMKTINVLQFNINTSDTIFNGTIFDGKLIQTNNNYIFLIQDCFYLNGDKILDTNMNDKMNILNNIINTQFKTPSYCKNFEFKLNKLYNYNELEGLITSLPKLPIPNNGLVFYPMQSGITIIHIEKKVETVAINSTTNKEVIEQKSYHIINDFLAFLKSRTYSYEANSIMKHMWLSRTEIPDVYDISEKENGDKISIALVPNLKISQMCDDIIMETPVRFNCVFSNKFKKWIPLNTI